MNVKLIYVTAPSKAEAVRIAETVVSEQLAACANIMGGAESVFEWEGELRHEQEAVLILKTAAARVAELTERIQTLHSYDCPCIVSLPIESGNPEFLRWVETATAR